MKKKAKPPAKLRLNVTKKDILLGEVVNGGSCPVARAAKRVAGKEARVWAYTSFLVVGKKKYDFPMQVEDFIDNFDFGRPVQPFKITLTEGVSK